MRSQKYLRFEVEDSGIGIRDEKKLELFKPYHPHHLERTGGTGLGLYSLSQRVSAIAGQCGVMDRRDGGEGSLFWFSIPYLADTAAAAVTGSPSGSMRTCFMSTRSSSEPISDNGAFQGMFTSRLAPGISKDGRDEQAHGLYSYMQPQSIDEDETRSVLVVDDSIVIQKTAARMLKACGFSVDVASNGKSGLDLMVQKRYDLVLMGKGLFMLFVSHVCLHHP
jgi:hypothetical protein